MGVNICNEGPPISIIRASQGLNPALHIAVLNSG